MWLTFFVPPHERPRTARGIERAMKDVLGKSSSAVLPLGEALAYAERCRTEGRLMEAEAVCRQVLGAQPNLPEAAHLLGVIAHQNGKLGEAIEHAQRAAKLAPH